MSSCLSTGRARRRETSLSGLRDLRERKARNIGTYTLVFTGGREDDILIQ